MYAPPKDIETSVYARLPEELHATEMRSAWLQGRGAPPTHSFLEGPSFDRAGNLYTVDLAHGRIFRIAPDRSWSVFADYDGIPNGLKLHRDGRIFVADHQNGLLVFDPETGEIVFGYEYLDLDDDEDELAETDDEDAEDDDSEGESDEDDAEESGKTKS